ncbi:MAG TPA: 4-hydroxy-3-methylbut-2-enyl diphosphate reductase [Limnochordia bacterium]|nr:4-hydroxy-3-methylbut-2-enyl diphosphate reductase [Limnochordia bacterium]
MKVIKITPRGYCYGVVDAIQIAKQVARDKKLPRPLYILGMIVHNHHVVEELEALGVRTLDGGSRLDLLDHIEGGTVIFTAHGVSPQVKAAARARGLNCIDATCPDVTRTHDLVADLVGRGYQVIYIGKHKHPEPEGVVGIAPESVHLVETEADLDALRLDAVGPMAVTCQTTLSQWDTASLIRQIEERYPGIEVYNEICFATQSRQEAAAEQARGCDVVIVVGDRRSNNSNRLVQVVREIAERPAYLVDNVSEIEPAWLAGAQVVGVTSGSSTPTTLTRAVIEFLERYAPAQASL